MCTGAEAAMVVGAVASAAGTAYSMDQQASAQKRQEEAAIANLLQQQGIQDRADAAVNAQLQQFKPEVREERQAAIEENLGEGYQAALDRAELSAPRTASDVAGNVSSDYLSAAARAKAGQLARGSQLATLLSRIDAPGYRNQQEGWLQSDLGHQLGVISRGGQAQDAIGRMRINAAGQIDPSSAIVSGLLQAGGSAIASNAGSWGSPSTTTGVGNARVVPNSQVYGGVPSYTGTRVTGLT